MPLPSARIMGTTTARVTRLATMLLLVTFLLAACGSSKPTKYRKKRGCDCPHWNQQPTRTDGVRAGMVTVTPKPTV